MEEKLKKIFTIVMLVVAIAIIVTMIGMIVEFIVNTVNFAKKKADQMRAPEVAVTVPIYSLTHNGQNVATQENGYPLTVGQEYVFKVSFDLTPNKTTDGTNRLRLNACFGDAKKTVVRMEQANASEYEFEENDGVNYLDVDFLIPRNKETFSAQVTVVFTPQQAGSLRFDFGFACNEMAISGDLTASATFTVGEASNVR